jgi:hypothetical protein
MWVAGVAKMEIQPTVREKIGGSPSPQQQQQQQQQLEMDDVGHERKLSQGKASEKEHFSMHVRARSGHKKLLRLLNHQDPL